MAHNPARKFAHLHQHTQFSLLDGAARLKDLLSWVKQVSPEEPMLAMTDHGNLFGAVHFYKQATEMGVKPIIGYEAYVAAESRFDRKQGKGLDGGYFHLTLLAKDMEGYKNLCRLASRAYLEGFYQKPRIDREILREHSAGIIVLSGCLGAEIPQFILQERYEEAQRRLEEYLAIFGPDRYFIEIQDHGLPEQRKVNKVLKEFADRYGLGVVATNDGHYVRKEDAEAHAVILAVQSKSTWDDPNRWRFPCDEFYLKSPEEMRRALEGERELWGSRFEELFDNSLHIGRMCDVELVPKKVQYRIPKYPLPEGRTEAIYLRELTLGGLLKRYPDRVTPELYREFLRRLGRPVPHGDGEALALALAQVEDLEAARAHLPELKEGMPWDGWAILARAFYELSVIERMGFSGYLLIVSDFINWAKDQGISVGPGRGSAAGSLVAYATRITNIDPLAYNLLFERFLNPARVSMPDIDTDFSDVRRGEVIDYVRRRYGDDKVAQIGTFGTIAAKAAIKDAARVFGLPVKKADELAKLVPVTFGKPMPLDKAIETIPDLRAEMEKDPLVKRVLEVAQRLEGLSRQSSVHAAGVVIADVPLQDYIPLMRAGDTGAKVTQYDMGSVEALGFLKMDFLGLRALSQLEECKRIIWESKGIKLDYDKLPMDDAKTFEILGRGETKGVFQLDSAGMTNAVRGLKPRRIQDIIALGALYRPGPMENIPTYIRRHHGREEVSYPQFPHAERFIRPILEETYGIPVYQEQIMQIATAVAGYSLGEADLLRRAMGKKKMEEMVKHRAQFREGAARNGIPAEEADRLFDLLEAFANYGFNKSHAAAYAILTYQTAYVKAHFPVEFFAALLTVERHDSDKVAEYIRAARAAGVEVLPPDINRSSFSFSALEKGVLFGLSAVKNVGETPTELILKERERGGPFRSLPDFLRRLDGSVANKRVVESLIKAGAFDAFGPRGPMLAALDDLLKWAQAERERSQSGMMGLFDEVQEPSIPKGPLLDALTELRMEKEALGIYVTGHPLLRYEGLREAASCTIEELPRAFAEQRGARNRVRLLLAGMVEGIQRKPTKSGGMLIRFTLADETGAAEVVGFGRAYERISPRLAEDAAVLVVAEVEPDGEGEALRVVAQEVYPHHELEGLPKVLELELELALVDEERLLDLRSRLDECAGPLPVQLKVRGPGGWALVEAREVRASEEAVSALGGLDWLSVRLVPDREALLRLEGNGASGPKGAEQGPVVPF
ncbi:DNA polymerase III subunit alpha [Meiothermus luteus]|uniref:DNA polymerase III subunit alpha n=1 Tax=Meiothermus luteus TaxID=2026184 RepID=A0A399ESP9_9DEIN|nr:DNA polymerase III subunit alpha [Meiothermus luteus]RIH86825.1 DNA polymerase III subunit alpha [Meiothermus luteus]RMH57104.1 MAG: DNA polymerase III subunit alpha [Deinococcota bacterium]